MASFPQKPAGLGPAPAPDSLFAFDGVAVERALGGDRAAFEEICVALVQRFDAVRRNIERISPGRRTEFYEKACDLFLDRVLRVFREPPEEAVANFNALCGTFLKCAIRDAVDWFHAQRRDQRREVAGDAPLGPGAGSATLMDALSAEVAGRPFGTADAVFEEMDRKALAEDVAEALAELKPAHRRVVALWMHGYTEREIAGETGFTTSNVGSVVCRAIKRLRARLQEDGRLSRHR